MQHKLLQQPPACPQPPLQALCTSSLLCLCLHQPGRRPRPPPWHRGGAAELPELGDAILPLVCEGTSSVRHERSCSTCRKMRSCHDIWRSAPPSYPYSPTPLLNLQSHPLLTLQPLPCLAHWSARLVHPAPPPHATLPCECPEGCCRSNAPSTGELDATFRQPSTPGELQSGGFASPSRSSRAR